MKSTVPMMLVSIVLLVSSACSRLRLQTAAPETAEGASHFTSTPAQTPAPYFLTLTATLSITPPTHAPSAKVTSTPIRWTSTPTRSPDVLLLSWSDGGGRAYYAYRNILEDARTLQLPLTPLPEDSPSAFPQQESSSSWVIPAIGDASRLDVYALEAAAYLRSHSQTGVNDLTSWLREQGVWCEDSVWAYATDAGKKHIYLLTLSLPRPDETTPCDGDWARTQVVYLLICQEEVYCTVRRPTASISGLENWRIVQVQDITGDDQPEAFLLHHDCGASDCTDVLRVVSLDGHYLAPPISVHNGYIIAADENGDGIDEIYAGTSDYPGYLGGLYDNKGRSRFGPFNEHLIIYWWNDTGYALAGRAYTHNCLFHLAWDGVQWAREGYFQTALAVFQAARNSDLPSPCDVPDEIPFPWETYIEFATGMLEARVGKTADAWQILQHAREIDTEGIYRPLIDVFLASFSDGYEAGCAALNAYLETYRDSSFRGPYQARQMTTFCPGD
ncbi:MAG: hypothetical protein Fur0043_26490 [Anaerolineales bacterium]